MCHHNLREFNHKVIILGHKKQLDIFLLLSQKTKTHQEKDG